MKKPSFWSFAIPFIIILVFGTTTILSTAPSLIVPQIVFILIGFFFLLLLSLLNRHYFENLGLPIYLFCLFQLFLTYLIGSISRGSLRWIDLGPFRYQTSEFAKPLLIISLAFLFQNQKWGLKTFIKNLFLVAIPAVLVFFQPDLGSAMIISLVGLMLMIHSGVPLKYPLILIILFILLSPFAYRLMHDYQRERILSFIDPYSDPARSGYNVIQATVAIGSGQLFGKGVLQGTQSHLRFLPERHTDFAFASFAEEFGFVGVSLLFICFYLVLNYLSRLSNYVTDLPIRLVCLGAFWLIFFQTVVNVGMNLGILPVTGITLPFVSYGGSSLISLFLVLGLVFALTKGKNIVN